MSHKNIKKILLATIVILPAICCSKTKTMMMRNTNNIPKTNGDLNLSSKTTMQTTKTNEEEMKKLDALVKKWTKRKQEIRKKRRYKKIRCKTPIHPRIRKIKQEG